MVTAQSAVAPAWCSPPLCDNSHEAVDDTELIRGALAGRQADFESLIERHQKALYGFTLRALGHHADADDVVQATFVQAYTKLANFRGESSFKTWLFRIAMNLCRDRRRRERRRRETPWEDVLAASGDQAGAVEPPIGLQSSLQRWVQQLPHRQRSVLSLRIYADLPFRDIARLEGISEGSAKVSYHHAIKRLKQWLE